MSHRTNPRALLDANILTPKTFTDAIWPLASASDGLLEGELEVLARSNSQALQHFEDVGLNKYLASPDNLNILARVIELQQCALKWMPAEDIAGRLKVQARLSRCLTLRFAKTNCHADLDKAIEIGRQVVANTSTTEDTHTDKIERLVALGSQLTMRSIHNQSHDLDEAINIFEQALSELPGTYPSPKARELCIDLCGLLFRRSKAPSRISIGTEHEEDNDSVIKDLDRAIEVAEQAVGFGTPPNPSGPAVRGLLAMLLHTKFERTAIADIKEIERAIEWSKAAVAGSQWLEDPVEGRAKYLVRLGACLQSLYSTRRLGTYQWELEEAITMVSQAVELMQASDDVKCRAEYMDILCGLVQVDYRPRGEPQRGLTKAIELIQCAL